MKKSTFYRWNDGFGTNDYQLDSFEKLEFTSSFSIFR
jgi:hypothetical protein